jgi:transcriptional regulator with XRE-family HTH domain
VIFVPKDPLLSLWGKNIAHQRESLKLSREQLAELVGVRRPTVSRWEAGLIEPTRDRKNKIAEVLHADVSVMFPMVPIRRAS